ncbi:MAG: AbrB/MazE/SpoVT family DNA-binding domain-containing protein [Myxococcota bacterium]
MPSATVTSKGQITIPKAVRDSVGLATGDRVSFAVRGDGVVEMVPETVELMSLFGSLKPRLKGVTLEQMEQAIAQGGAGE